jgi:hypothetical protein
LPVSVVTLTLNEAEGEGSLYFALHDQELTTVANPVNPQTRENPLQPRHFTWRITPSNPVQLKKNLVARKRSGRSWQKKPQLQQNKYFVRKLLVINILQTPPPCKSLKIIDLLAKYPQGRGGGGADITGKKGK